MQDYLNLFIASHRNFQFIWQYELHIWFDTVCRTLIMGQIHTLGSMVWILLPFLWMHTRILKLIFSNSGVNIFVKSQINCVRNWRNLQKHMRIHWLNWMSIVMFTFHLPFHSEIFAHWAERIRRADMKYLLKNQLVLYDKVPASWMLKLHGFYTFKKKHMKKEI